MPVETNDNNEDKSQQTNKIKVDTSFQNILLSYVNTGKSSQINTPIKRRRICTGAEIITKDDYLKKIEAENEIKKKKMEKKNKGFKKHITGDVEVQNLHMTGANTSKNLNIKKVTGNTKPTKKKRQLSSSSESENLSEKLSSSESDLETVGPIAIEDDYVIVIYNMIYFPGRVIERDQNRVKVKCFEKYGKLGNSWRWPKVEDSIWYDDSEVVRIIPPPKLMNNRGIYNVPVMQI